MMEKLFLIFLGIRPFFENTLKNSHFALENANFGVEISAKDLKDRIIFFYNSDKVGFSCSCGAKEKKNAGICLFVLQLNVLPDHLEGSVLLIAMDSHVLT